MIDFKQAIIFDMNAILRVVEDEQGYRWEFDPRLPGLLRDCRATGHRIFALLNPKDYGLDLEGEAEKLALIQYINEILTRVNAPPFDAIHIHEDLSDPTPIWEWRRRFGFDLSSVSIVGSGPIFEELRNNAGISTHPLDVHSEDELFLAHPFGF